MKNNERGGDGGVAPLSPEWKMKKNIINERIKGYRIGYLDVSQEEFSKKTGLDLQHLQQLEDGSISASVADIVSISKAYNVSTDFLTGRILLPIPVLKSDREAQLWNSLVNAPFETLSKAVQCLKKMEDAEENDT